MNDLQIDAGRGLAIAAVARPRDRAYAAPRLAVPSPGGTLLERL
jgi:hypothetical protein